ncbi:hypothetical protein KACHI17_04910 [Sediminibacterium sp. KACHI17]|uniref:Uncharacterized protein n=1 Tax=Sediminibacterium sp. KACHI17 TaxID=1751071 RepID=A0AAT9GG48_9BACT
MITGAELQAAKSVIGTISGVISKLTAVFDNSTSRWKSRLPELKKLTPDQRIAFYINEMQQNKDFHASVVQYAELFGKSPNGKGIDDRGKVSYQLLKAFNDLADLNYFKGAEYRDQGFRYWKKDILNDLSIAPDKPSLDISAMQRSLGMSSQNVLSLMAKDNPTYQLQPEIKKASIGNNIIISILILLSLVGLFFGFNKKNKRSYR